MRRLSSEKTSGSRLSYNSIANRKMVTLKDSPAADTAEVYDDGFLRVEHENYYVACDGANVPLPRAEFLIFSRLARTPERFVASAELWRQAWGERKRFNAVSLHVYMYRLRRKFEKFGVRIETMVNVGYRLVPCNRN